MFINGKLTSGNATEKFPVINPATEEILTEVYRGVEADCNRTGFQPYFLIDTGIYLRGLIKHFAQDPDLRQADTCSAFVCRHGIKLDIATGAGGAQRIDN